MTSPFLDGPGRRPLAALIVLASLPTTGAAGQTRDDRFLGLTAPRGTAPDFWEGRTNYRLFLRPTGEIRAILLFARFPDAEGEESTRDLYDRLVPEGAAFFTRASYGQMTLKVDVRHRWIALDRPSTWAGYDQSNWDTHRSYVAEAVRKAGKDVDFGKYDIVYIVASKDWGTPKSPTWRAHPGRGIRAGDAEIRHAVTFGNDVRNRNWGWQTLTLETGHVFGLPDLYPFKVDTSRCKDFHRYGGCWDVMG